MRNQFTGNLVLEEETFEKEETFEIPKETVLSPFLEFYMKICSVIILIFLLSSDKKQQQQQQKSE